MVFGVERFHEYLYGRRFIVINDHKPLKSTFNRSIISFPPRILKFFLRLQKYDFQLQYSPGKNILVSDTLSRSHLTHFQPEFAENRLIHHAHFVLSNLTISATRLKQFQLETRNDPILQTLIIYIPWMARKAPHTHRFTSALYSPQWYYILWRHPFEKWTNHSTHNPSCRNEIPYPPRAFRNWKLQKTR